MYRLNCNLKSGRIIHHFDNNSSICLEYSCGFNPLQFYFEFDGDEGRWIFSFWFIYTFYISLTNYKLWFPKEYNSSAKKMLSTATRRIGISNYSWRSITIYFWHDGEDSWYESDNKISYKYIALDNLFIGTW